MHTFYEQFHNIIHNLLQNFKGQTEVELNVLGLLQNIAEVTPLRNYLIKPDIIIVLRYVLYHMDLSKHT